MILDRFDPGSSRDHGRAGETMAALHAEKSESAVIPADVPGRAFGGLSGILGGLAEDGCRVKKKRVRSKLRSLFRFPSEARLQVLRPVHGCTETDAQRASSAMTGLFL